MATIKDIARILTEKYNMKGKDADVFVNAFVDVILEGLESDRLVKVKGLGTFKITSVKERSSINVNTGEPVTISGHDKISFTPDNMLKDLVNKPFEQFETMVLSDDVNVDDIIQSEEADDANVDNVEEPIMEPTATIVPFEAKKIVEEIVKSEEQKFEDVQEQESEDDVEPEVAEVLPEVAEVLPEVDEVKPEPQKEKVLPEPMEEEILPEPLEEEVKPEPENVIPEEEEIPVIGDEPNKEKLSGDEQEGVLDVFDGADDYVYRKKAWLYGVLCCVIVAIASFAGGYFCAQNDVFGQKKASQTEIKKPVVAKKPVKKSVKVKVNDTIVTVKESVAKVNDIEKTKQAKVSVQSKNAVATTASKKEADKPVALTQYYSDVRVRTGAYAIVGTKTKVTVRKGQTLSSLSKLHLGPGMDCYVEAYNGKSEVKEGDILLIPKIMLKKKLKK